MSILEYFYNKLKERINDIDVDLENNVLTVRIAAGSYVGMPLFEIILTKQKKAWKEKARSSLQHPIFIIVITSEKPQKYSLYISRYSFLHSKRFIYELLTDVREVKLKKELEKVIDFLCKYYDTIKTITDKNLEEFLDRIIDIESRVRDAGWLIATYIKYLELKEVKLREKIPDGWGKIVLQLMVMYYLHRKAEEENIEKLRFKTIEYLRDQNKRRSIDKSSYDIWYVLREDLEKLSNITRDLIFSPEEWDKLNREGIKIPNDVFIKNNFELLQSLKYEDLKQYIMKIRNTLGEKEIMSQFIKKYLDNIGILELFEIRKWYESGLIGDIVGGVYEGIKKLRERKKKGIYYTPRQIVEYIVNNTLDPYIMERVEEVTKKRYKSFEDFINDAGEVTLKKFYNDVLLKIRILDPACGTGHFLIYAMNKLAQYYKAVKEKVKKEGYKNFKIEYIENGKRVERELAEIPDEEFDFLIRQHFILKNNIYGVDIDREAHLIAKARIAIEVFKYYNKNLDKKYYTFPNLEMNIKEGNSLIGFTDFDEAKEFAILRSKETLDYYLGKKDSIESLMMEVKIGKISTSIYQKQLEIYKKNIDHLYLEYIKLKAIKKGRININIEEFRELKPFHWFLEFPKVFDPKTSKEERGFDIIVGNPPYGNLFEDGTRVLQRLFPAIQQIYPFSSPSKDKSAIFIERCARILNRKGKFGMIVPLNIARIEKFRDLRKFLINNVSTYRILDSGNPFAGSVELEMIVIFYDLRKRDKFFVESLKPVTINKEGVPYNVIKRYDYRFILYWDEFYDRILKDAILGWLEVSQGIPRRADYSANGEYLCISAKALDRYVININKIQWDRKVTKNFIITKGIRNQLDEALITPFSLGKTGKVTDLAFECVLKPRNMVPDGTTILIRINNSSIDRKFALVILNSSLINYIMCRYILSYGVRIFRNYLLYMLPLHLPLDQSPYIILADYMLFLNAIAIENKDSDIEKYIEFIDRQIIDSLVYELYLKEKFFEDRIYPEPKEYLLKVISKYLKPINYNNWAELYWEKHLASEFSCDKEAELQGLGDKNLAIIRDVVSNIKSDKEIMELIKKIKSHPWVRRIEEEFL